MKGKFGSAGLTDRSFEAHGLGFHGKYAGKLMVQRLKNITPSSNLSDERAECTIY